MLSSTVHAGSAAFACMLARMECLGTKQGSLCLLLTLETAQAFCAQAGTHESRTGAGPSTLIHQLQKLQRALAEHGRTALHAAHGRRAGAALAQVQPVVCALSRARRARAGRPGHPGGFCRILPQCVGRGRATARPPAAPAA